MGNLNKENKKVITISKDSIQSSKPSIPRLKLSSSNDEQRRLSLLDILPEFELTKIERLQSELKASEQVRK